MVQHGAARFVSGNYHRQASVGAIMMGTLQQRRRQVKAVMMYNIINNIVAVGSSTFLYLHDTSTRGHGMRYIQPYFRTQILRESIFPTANYIWNQPPATLVATPTLEAIKTRVVTTSHKTTICL